MAVDLEAGLRELAASLEFPSSDDLVARVIATLSESEPHAEPGGRGRGPRRDTAGVVPLRRRPVVRRVGAFAAAAILVGAMVLAVSGRARHAVADLLGIGAIDIRSSSTPASAAPTTPAAATTTSPPASTASGTPATTVGVPPTTALLVPPGLAGLGLGQPVAPAGGARQLGIPTPVPPGLGPPDAAYLGSSPPGGELSLLWPPGTQLPPSQVPGVGALLTVFRGQVDDRFIAKVLNPGTTYERVLVNGKPAVWLAGAPHEFLYTSPDGTVSSEPLRLAGNTLIWTNGAFTYRLESGLDRAAAIALAQTVPV